MHSYRVRPAEDKDKLMVLGWRNHPDVRAVMLTNHQISETEHSAWWDKTMQMEERQLLIFERNNTPVGVITIYAWDKSKATAWWGFYLDNANLEQSEKTAIWLQLEQEVIRYSDVELQVFELYCESLKSNQLAWKLHEKLGFKTCELPGTATQTDKNVVYMKYQYAHNKPDLRPELYLFASHNTDFLTETLSKEIGKYPQFPYKIQKTQFGQYQLDLLDKSKSNLNNLNSCYIFIERIEDLFTNIYTLPIEDALLETERRVMEYLSFIEQIAKRGNKVFVSDFSIQKDFPYSLEEQKDNSRLRALVSDWNNVLYELKASNTLEVLPYAQLLKSEGQSFANKYWYMARLPFSINCLERYAQVIIGSIFASQSLSARALVLDLDNTLWKGVIGDDGMEGISLGGDYPGNIYKELQSLFLALKQRGVLLTICSKNTESIALNAIKEHPEMRLREDDFVSWRINWNAKSQNIQELAKELNLGLSSLCFIDDNPVEREEVRRNAVGVFVPELPEDPSEWYQFISRLPELMQDSISESDKRRAELYKKRVDIQKAQISFTDRTEFLKELDMSIRVEPLDEKNFERTFQLFSKTNQFNTTTTRYSKEQLSLWAESSDVMVWHVKSKDKYSSEYEGVAALVIQKESSRWIVDNFVMSCRVMGRDIEHALLSYLLNKARKTGISKVLGKYTPSSKNMPVSKLYADNRFKEEAGEWCFNLDIQVPPSESKIIKLEWVE
ncbi:UDP-4-amino-4,6-dideoxy-N-acetyl-beta-L-altrosamine N-acetyltransferase [Vibrio breoganii]|uniref:UDP-4-amino-4, 6-dideoxy-N-acetyl-beta-L-altrosamine N-acetyltransferase n=1 Tax=Vibrio breoganii TaxID=553239 RepID=UPI000C84FC9F|nr:UDP-4-amino-4,6-dideoxy-N-acetyl-beta-L-altrosamine N-acetyltransferase [Vibrio breoganii]PMO91540.1 UDP-4-amino-4,6-dideoxy-N-acetyl-beta-L-altrosamine N-acetyltransferase [Vibrio breoganii]